MMFPILLLAPSSMLRVVVCACLAVSGAAFQGAAPMQLSKVAGRASQTEMMFSTGKPKPKAAPKAAAPKKADTAKGKGGILPWVKNEPGTYAELPSLSSFDFTGDDGDKLVGWGGMPKSVKALYNAKGSKGLFGK